MLQVSLCLEAFGYFTCLGKHKIFLCDQINKMSTNFVIQNTKLFMGSEKSIKILGQKDGLH